MPGLAPGMYVITTNRPTIRGWRDQPGQDPKEFSTLAQLNHARCRHADRIGCDPDVVAAGGADSGHRKDSSVSAGDHDVCDRRAGRIFDLDRAARGEPLAAAANAGVDYRRRRSVWLSRALFSRAAL